MKKFLILLFIIFAICFNCYANDDIALNSAKRLRITNYNTYEIAQTENGYNIIYYGDNAYSVVTDSDGVILSYNKLGAPLENLYLPAIDKAEAKGNATVFISGAAADIHDQLEISTAEVTYNGNYRVVFYRKVRGIVFDADFVSVGVDGDTGEIIQYTRNFNSHNKFKEFDDIISAESVFERFKNLNKLELRYNKKLVGDKVVAYPVYSVDPLTYYNAINGSIIEGKQTIPYSNYFDVTSMYEKNNNSSGTQSVTLDASQVYMNVRSLTELGITDDYEILNARYLTNDGKKYLVVLDFSNGTSKISVTVDSKTGVVCEFNKDCAKTGDVKTNEQLSGLVKSYIDKYMADYSKNLRLSATSRTEDRTVYLYERIVSGVPFKSNGVCISLDKFGNITNISFLWDEIDFPNLKGIISKTKAYEIFKEKCNFKLRYIEYNGEYIPVYALNSLTTGIIDATTGDILTYDGKVMQPKKYLAYVDLDTHYSKPYVEKMADCDIYVSRGNVVLSDPIIQKDFMLLISQFLPAGKPVIENFGELTEGQLEMLYNAFISNGIMDISEYEPDGYITREKAISYLIKTIGYGDVAKNNYIFTDHFADSGSIDYDLRGYVELARGLGLISGNGTHFMPKAYLSNADSLIIVYNYLSKK